MKATTLDLKANTLESNADSSPFAHQDDMIDDIEMENQLIDEQSKQIFDLIFAQIFRFNARSNLFAITLNQFEEAIQDHSWNQFQTGVEQKYLLNMFKSADAEKHEQITKTQVLELIKNDLKSNGPSHIDKEIDLNVSEIFKTSAEKRGEGEIYGQMNNSKVS